MTVFCKDCKHYFLGLVINFHIGIPPSGHYCNRLRYLIDKEDLVTGPYQDWAGDSFDCRDERKTGKCGPEGIFYERCLQDDNDYSNIDWGSGII